MRTSETPPVGRATQSRFSPSLRREALLLHSSRPQARQRDCPPCSRRSQILETGSSCTSPTRRCACPTRRASPSSCFLAMIPSRPSSFAAHHLRRICCKRFRQADLPIRQSIAQPFDEQLPPGLKGREDFCRDRSAGRKRRTGSPERWTDGAAECRARHPGSLAKANLPSERSEKLRHDLLKVSWR